MNEDYEDTDRFEYIGIANVRFNAQGQTSVAVYRDHQEKCIHMKRVPFGTPSLAWIPAYDEEAEAKLWEQINAHKRKGSRKKPTARFMTRRTNRNRKPTSRFITRASVPTDLPMVAPRSYKNRTASTKPMTVKEVSAIVAESLGDLLGGDSE